MNVQLRNLIFCLITMMISTSYSEHRGKNPKSTRVSITGMDPILKKQILDFIDFI